MTSTNPISNGIKLTGAPAEIPDCSRDDLPTFFVEMGYRVGAEIGVYKGEFTEKFCQAGLAMYGIDPWLAYGIDKGSPKMQDVSGSNYSATKNRLKIYTNCTIIRKTSMEAVTDFPDNSLDFVYIDGDHELKFVTEDIREWTKKVKPGGTIAGHDYVKFRPRTLGGGICDVIAAVNTYTQANRIKKWYVLGRKEAPPGEKRDRWRSWMWIKDYAGK